MNNFLSQEKRNIQKLIIQLSKSLNVEKNSLTFIEEKLEQIILKKSLNDMIETYFSLLEEEMATLIALKITPSFQFGIKNKYFTIIGYHGKYNAIPTSKDITNKTFYSFDSISKILTSVITMLMIRDGKITLESTINDFNKDFNMNASIGSILKFTARIETEKRIENLSTEETIQILKSCRENIIEKSKYKNYYQYNDLGYMILRLSIPNFLERLDTVIALIDKDNLTYKNKEHKEKITGGRLGLEYITPDNKGKNILFPGHTGLYGNIEGLLNLFYQVFYTNNILTKEELQLLLQVPYKTPEVYTKTGERALNKNGTPLYMAKVGGVYRTPTNILESKINKMASCDFSNLTTNNAMSSAGTCGSWVMGDNLSYQNMFGTYTGGILTNPYSYINVEKPLEEITEIPNTNLTISKKGTIIGYSTKLNPYKEIISKYGLILELLTEYIKNYHPEYNLEQKHITYTRKLKKL